MEIEKEKNKNLDEENQFVKLQVETIQKQLDRKTKEKGDLDLQVSMLKADLDDTRKQATKHEVDSKTFQTLNGTLKQQLEEQSEKNNKLEEINREFKSLI